MYNGRSRRLESDPYGPPPKRVRTSGFDTGRDPYRPLPPLGPGEPLYPLRYEARGYEPLGVLDMHDRRHARDSGLLGTPDHRSLASGAYPMDARGAPGVLLEGVRRSSAGGVVLPFPPAPGGGPHVGPLPPLPVVRCRGLPFQCSEEDVVEFFAGLEVLDVVLPRKEGRATGDAWVLLASLPQRDHALQRSRMRMGRRYVEVFQSQRQDYYKAIIKENPALPDGQAAADTGRPAKGPPPSGGSQGKGDAPAGPSRQAPAQEPEGSPERTGGPAAGDGEAAEAKPGRKSSVLRLRGLPFAATRMDVVDFFEGFHLAEAHVHLLQSAQGKNTGEGFVEFHSPGEAAAAMAKDRSKIGSRYVELFPCTEEEAIRGLTRAAAN